MSDYEVRITGDSGLPVLLLAGGAATTRDFFPGLVAALPGHRVIELDRPGTGRAMDRGTATLASGSAACADVLKDLGPAVVVGQSLGGGLAVAFAADHPELVAGLVLIDPTPLNDPKTLKNLGRVIGPLSAITTLPFLGPKVDQLIFRASTKKFATDTPEQRAGIAAISSASTAQTAAAVKTLPAEGAAVTARLVKLDVPAVLMTGDRLPDHGVRLAHERLAGALGARLVTWPDAEHAEHLRDAKRVNDLVVSVVDEALARTR
jgi:pimeloyl-ACP methyl ester carboxylesterase